MITIESVRHLRKQPGAFLQFLRENRIQPWPLRGRMKTMTKEETIKFTDALSDKIDQAIPDNCNDLTADLLRNNVFVVVLSFLYSKGYIIPTGE